MTTVDQLASIVKRQKEIIDRLEKEKKELIKEMIMVSGFLRSAAQNAETSGAK